MAQKDIKKNGSIYRFYAETCNHLSSFFEVAEFVRQINYSIHKTKIIKRSNSKKPRDCYLIYQSTNIKSNR
jgi:hypothetical protein